MERREAEEGPLGWEPAGLLLIPQPLHSDLQHAAQSGESAIISGCVHILGPIRHRHCANPRTPESAGLVRSRSFACLPAANLQAPA